MRVARQVLSIVLLSAVCLSSSGCFYQRLLTFKKQLKNFEDYFVLEEDDTISMIFKKPVMLSEDTVRFIGATPTAILGEAPNATYEYRMIKQYAPNQKDEGNFDYTYQVVMKDNKIERFVFDKRFFAATPRPMFVRACKMFGHAKVDVIKRSLTMGKVDSESYLEESVFLNADEIRQLSGIPFEEVQNTYVYKYRLQQDGDESSWPEMVSLNTFTDEGEFLRGETTILGGLMVERPLRIPTWPVPANATTVNQETLKTLAWTGGYKAKTHRVYGGEDELNLTLLAEVSDGTEIKLPARDTAAPYYWRVDAIEQDGTVHAGAIWHFLPGKLAGRWTFDEASGGIAHDVSGSEHHGTLQGDATFKLGAGILGGAVSLDGVGDNVDVNDVSLTAHTITMTAWVKGHQDSDWAGLIHFEDNLWGGGLYWVKGDYLYYNWYCDSLNAGSFQGPSLPQEEWIFVAVVVDYDQARLYVYTPSHGLKTKVNKAAHHSQSVGKLRFGWEDSNEAHRFTGLMDDIRVYNYALTKNQIKRLIKERDPSEAK